jgi:hypothetical protein
MPDKNRQIKPVLKFAGSALALQLIFTLLGILVVINTKGFIWPWWPGILGMVFASIVAFSIVISGIFLRRAYYLHISNSFMALAWVIPLLASGFEIASSNLIQIGIVLFFCVLNCIFYFRYTTKKLVDMKKVQMLDMKQARWNLSETLISKADKARSESLAKILIPLGPLLGTTLYRNFSDQNTISICQHPKISTSGR